MNQNYRFYVEAMTGDAVAKLQEIDKLMDRIDSKSDKGTQNFFHTTQREIDESISDMRKIIELKKELDKQFDKDLNMFGKGNQTEGMETVKGTLRELGAEFDRTMSKFDAMANMKANPNWINASVLKEQKVYRDELTETEKSLLSLKRNMGEMQRTASRAQRAVHSATSTGKMTHLQANRLKADFSKGDTIGDMISQNDSRRTALRGRYEEDNYNLSMLRKDTSIDPMARKNEETAIQERIKATQKEIDEINKATDTLKELSASFNNMKQSMDTGSVNVDPSKDSVMGIIQSRAPSIAMASIGAVAGVFGGLYAKGASANAGMRDASISIGQRTGNGDFRALRKEMQQMGVDRSLGYKGADMLQFQDDVLSNMGFTNPEETTATTKALAEGTRAVPVDKESMSGFMNDVMRNGAVDGKAQVKAIQEGFLGAIEQSGMAGREKEQLEALKEISAQAFTGRNGSNEELRNIMAMQSMLSATGDRAVQGEAGGELLASLDAGIKGTMDDPITRMMMGSGTKYKGPSGYYQQSKQMEKGLGDPQNVRDIMGMIYSVGDGTTEANEHNKGVGMMALKERLNMDITSDEIDSLFKAFGDGNLSDEQLAKALEDQNLVGKKKYNENTGMYEDSHEATDNASEATTELKATEIHDMGDKIREVNSALSGLNPVIYASILALGAWTASLAGSGLMGLGSKLLKGQTVTKFASAGGTAGKMGAGVSKIAESFKAGKASSGVMGGIREAATTGKAYASGAGQALKGGWQAGGFKGVKNVAKSLFSSSDDVASAVGGAAKGGSKLGKFFGKAGGVLGKIATPLMIASSIFDIATSDDKVKAVGSNGGMFAGAAGGAKLGAAAGTAIAPGIGTAIGGAIGGIGGGILGSKAGGWLIDKVRGAGSWAGEKLGSAGSWVGDKLGKGWQGVKNFFGGEEAEASEITPGVGTEYKGMEGTYNQAVDATAGDAAVDEALAKGATGKKENRVEDKEDKDTSNMKVLSEKNREANNAKESDNLSFYSKLLDRAMQILNRARAQNGIFGNSGYGSGGAGDDSEGEMGEGGGKEYNGEWKEAIKDAGKQMNVDLTEKDINDILRLIETESGGDEKVMQQIFDENSTNGSGGGKGLLQYIQPTFDAYKAEGHGDILSGYDQLIAFLNNTNWRKDLDNWDARMAQGITGWGPSGSKRFAMGGRIDSPTEALMGEVPGQSEYVINPRQPTAPRLLAEASAETSQRFRLFGDHNDFASRVAGINASGESQGAASNTYNNTNDIRVTVQVKEGTPKEMAQEAGNAMSKKMLEVADNNWDFFTKEYSRR